MQRRAALQCVGEKATAEARGQFSLCNARAMESLMDKYPPDEFDVDLDERKVIHRESGIWFSFYEYPNEGDWKRTDSVIYRDNPAWEGDRRELAAAAKHAAILKGMKGMREHVA
jgi:hypothetical protein